MTKSQKEFYTPTELAEMFSYNVMTIYRYIEKGELIAYKFGKEYRIDKKEIERYLDKIKTKEI